MSDFEFLKEHVDPTDSKFNMESWFRRFGAQYKIKSAICKQQNPKLIVEIGVRAGYSALCFMHACPAAKYIGYDNESYGQGNNFTQWARQLLNPYDAEIRIVNTQAVGELALQNVDFAHIDGNHAQAAVEHDLNLIWPCLSDSGTILLDDMCMEPVNRAIRDWMLLHESEINYEYVLSRTGEMIIRKAGNHTRFYQTK